MNLCDEKVKSSILTANIGASDHQWLAMNIHMTYGMHVMQALEVIVTQVTRIMTAVVYVHEYSCAALYNLCSTSYQKETIAHLSYATGPAMIRNQLLMSMRLVDRHHKPKRSVLVL